ncbi:MAG TPA: hypothetical protein VFJ77_07655 [Gaiellaceae bacterium]|nr:hypothetical protein [Gaiellaceae bacterium]
MQTPEPEPRPSYRSDPALRAPRPAPRVPAGGADWGERLAWVAGLVLAISAFTDWYVGSLPDGLTLAVTGWHTGPLGKLVFFLGLATLILEALREAGIELPATVPERLVLLAFGALATIFVLIRLLSVPDTYFAVTSRGVGVWIALVAALALIAAGLLRDADEY